MRGYTIVDLAGMCLRMRTPLGFPETHTHKEEEEEHIVVVLDKIMHEEDVYAFVVLDGVLDNPLPITSSDE